MGTWNYRVLAFVDTERQETTYKLCEVYYDENGIPDGYADYISLNFESVEDLGKELVYYKEALDKPVLYAGDKFPEEYINNLKQ